MLGFGPEAFRPPSPVPHSRPIAEAAFRNTMGRPSTTLVTPRRVQPGPMHFPTLCPELVPQAAPKSPARSSRPC